MAIHPELESAQASNNGITPVDIEAWTEDAVQAMATVAISSPSPGIRGTSVTLDIPLDEHPVATSKPSDDEADGEAARKLRPGYQRRREPIRRDSLKRREALLKGKEGSRRRQRWENGALHGLFPMGVVHHDLDRLLSNPYMQPPLPSDWEVRPTYPVHSVPYILAPLWDAGIAARAVERKVKAKKAAQAAASPEGEAASRIPKELREKLKRARGAKGLLQDLEQEVRKFVEKWEEKDRNLVREGMVDPDSEDEEIVFVGRNGQMSDMSPPMSLQEELRQDHLVLDSLEGDQGATFGYVYVTVIANTVMLTVVARRWLVHSIGAYYGLRTWSITTGNPARREAYVGIPQTSLKSGRRRSSVPSPLPRPLYCLV